LGRIKAGLVSGVCVLLLFVAMLGAVLNVPLASGQSGTIYIRADGSIDPPTAPISTVDNVTYTFTDSIYDSIVGERNNIVLNGNGYTLQGTGAYAGETGIEFWTGSNVTIKNTTITAFGEAIKLHSVGGGIVIGNNMSSNGYGVILDYSQDANVSDNTITGSIYAAIQIGNTVVDSIAKGNYLMSNNYGVRIDFSEHNNISSNFIASNGEGIWLSLGCNYNSFSDNNITSNAYGIYVDRAFDNIVYCNDIENNGIGTYFFRDSYYNKFYHNNFVGNTQQAGSYDGTPNTLNDDYPSGGNYWSDYTGVDERSGPNQDILGSDGMGDTPYVIDANNRDNYPLMKPYPWATHDVGITSVTTSKNIVGQQCNVSIDVMIFNYGDDTETINITIYANQNIIGETYNIDLTSRNFTVIPFTWNNTGFVKGNYTIWAYAWPVQGEVHTLDNDFTGGWVYVAMVGDINGDGKVDVKDVYAVAKAYGTSLEGPNPPDRTYAPNCDINNDGKIDIKDYYIVCKHYGETDP